jgi:hypothetical protein
MLRPRKTFRNMLGFPYDESAHWSTPKTGGPSATGWLWLLSVYSPLPFISAGRLLHAQPKIRLPIGPFNMAHNKQLKLVLPYETEDRKETRTDDTYFP